MISVYTSQMKVLFWLILLTPLFLTEHSLFIENSFARSRIEPVARIDRAAYFAAFNFYDSFQNEQAEKIEAEMQKQSAVILEWAKNNPNELNHDAGMYLVYTAMLMLERNNAFIDKILYDVTITPAVISERYTLAKKLLDASLILADGDERIHSWMASSQFRGERYQTGTVSESTYDQVIELVKKSPIFNLINALIMSSDSDFGVEREKVLLETTELMSGKDSPCWPPISFLRRGESKLCNTTSKTPYAIQGISTYFGDEFLKYSLSIRAQNPELADHYLERANKMYQRLNFFLFQRKTNQWAQKENLEERIVLVKKLQNEQLQNEKVMQPQVVTAFFKSKTFLNLYTCYACHQDGTSKKDLVVYLPKAKYF